jgi:hypothetical protein
MILDLILNILDRFSKNNKILNLIEIHLAGAELFHADRRTDMTKLIVAFHNSAKAPKNHPTASLNC